MKKARALPSLESIAAGGPLLQLKVATGICMEKPPEKGIFPWKMSCAAIFGLMGLLPPPVKPPASGTTPAVGDPDIGLSGARRVIEIPFGPTTGLVSGVIATFGSLDSFSPNPRISTLTHGSPPLIFKLSSLGGKGLPSGMRTAPAFICRINTGA